MDRIPHSLLYALLFPLVLLVPDLVSGKETYCDPSLSQVTDNPYGYRMRGDRCEGIYIKEVSNTILLIASLTKSFENYDLNSAKALLVESKKAPGDGGFRLRAQGLKRRLYYRMDTVVSPGSTTYTWPSDILAALSLQKKDIGVVGLTRYTVGGVERDIYLPLRIRQQGSQTQSGDYNLVVLPGVELTEVFLSLAPVGTDGRPHAFVREGEALGYGYYAAERVVEIPITGLKEPGIYYLEIGATLRGGGTTTVELWFFHPGG